MDFAPKIDQIVDKELSAKTRTSLLLLLFPWSNQKYLQELSIIECELKKCSMTTLPWLVLPTIEYKHKWVDKFKWHQKQI